MRHLAGGAEPVPGGQLVQRRPQAVHVEGLVAVVTQQQLVVVALTPADLAALMVGRGRVLYFCEVDLVY